MPASARPEGPASTMRGIRTRVQDTSSAERSSSPARHRRTPGPAAQGEEGVDEVPAHVVGIAREVHVEALQYDEPSHSALAHGGDDVLRAGGDALRVRESHPGRHDCVGAVDRSCYRIRVEGSPWTTSTPVTALACDRLPRTSSRTSWPCSSASRVTAAPAIPVLPKIAILMPVSPLVVSRDRRSPRAVADARNRSCSSGGSADITSGVGSDVRTRAVDKVASLADRSTDLVTFWRSCTEVISTVVPHYWAPCFFTFDPASLLVTSHFHEGLDEFPADALAREYYGDDVHKLVESCSPRPECRPSTRRPAAIRAAARAGSSTCRWAETRR